MDIKGKKLLILGGMSAVCEIVKEAKKIGIKTYVTDYLADSPAKKVADGSFMVSATDVDEVVFLCEENMIDGVFTGYNDMLLPYYQKVCEKIKKPFWGNKENIQMCIDKEKFKIACEEVGVPVVPWIKVDKDNYHEVIDKINLPVVIKPADYSGSKGVYKCYDKNLLCDCIERSLAFSKAGKVIIEKIMDANKEYSVYYIMNHGKYYLSAMGDRYVNIIDPNIAPVGRGMLYPSIYLEEWIEKMDSCIQSFFKKNNMNDGFVFIQGFYDDGNFYVHEIGYRLNGGFTYDIIQHFSGYNQMHQLLRFALTGDMNQDALAKSNPNFSGLGMIVTISLKPGKIGYIGGMEEIAKTPGILRFHALRDIGDELNAHGTTEQVFGYILCGVENKTELDKVIDLIREKLTILDVNGVSMLRDVIDAGTIRVKE